MSERTVEPGPSGNAAISSLKPKAPWISADAKVENMYYIKSSELKTRLENTNIVFDGSYLKHNLQALWALFNLGLVTAKKAPNKDLHDKVSEWCKSSVEQLLKEINEKGLDVMGNKWDLVEVLIRAEIDNREDYLADLTLDESGVSSDDQDEQPDHSVVNLLLATIYADVAKHRSTVLLSGSPVTVVQEVLDHINKLKAFTTAQSLWVALQPPHSGHENLLFWISSTYGGDIIPATGSLRVTGMPDVFHQFVLTKPTPVLQTRFEKHVAKVSGKSCVLYHGTPLRNLRSIICNGFRPSKHGNGLWMAENPAYSIEYAPRGAYLLDQEWNSTPYRNFGVILGCEAAGEGEKYPYPLPAGNAVHVITALDSIMIRYIFLLSQDSWQLRRI